MFSGVESTQTDASLYSTLSKMIKKFATHLDKKTPHKDRLVLVCLVAVLAFTVINTIMIATNVAVAASVAML